MQTTSNMDSTKCIYLDYNGTTPIHPKVYQAMIPYLTNHFGNPSSSHAYGQIPKEAVSKARKSISSLLGRDIPPECIIFTGCGSEADNLAIHLALQSKKLLHINDTTTTNNNNNHNHKSLPHIITSNVEHPAISECIKALEKRGIVNVTWVPVNEEGIVSVSDMMDAIERQSKDVILVTLMLANNESGSLQPVKEISKYCQERNILFHTDAAQAVGKVSISLNDDNDDDDNDNVNNVGGIGNVDMLTIVGHKFGAPKGIACLYIKPNCFTGIADQMEPMSMIYGGGQEFGKRAGTENVPYIVGLGTAADILMEKKKNDEYQWQRNAQWMETMRSRMKERFINALGDDIVRDNGPKNPLKRLPNTLSVGFQSVDAATILQNIQKKVACSAGSACHASGGQLSPVLKAMNVPLEYARGTLRLSVGPSTTEEDIDEASNIIIEEVKAQLGIK